MKKTIPAKLKKTYPIILEFKEQLKNLYGKRLTNLILFGSYARGNYHEESDIDFLVILTDMESPYKEIDFMAQIKSDFLLNYEKIISTVPTTIDRFEELNIPLYRNIKKEGIII